jgi:tRNA-Thr(GGU) m(6)t(6)A37 methyltransferase TsaA
MSAFEVRPIGVVRSTLTDPAKAPRQGDEGAPDARIEILPEFAAGLDGVRPGAKMVLLTWLHQADRAVLEVHPRDDATRPLAGVFGTRSADRPNPIGLHRVDVLAIDACVLTVRPLEAIDGTPVIDLKPVL